MANTGREPLLRDVELAREVQLSFLPRGMPALPGYEFSAYYQPAQEVGGDYYDFIPLADGRLALAVADVAGKGVSAALIAARLFSDTRLSLWAESDLRAAVRKLNKIIFEFAGQIDRFVTMVIAVIDPAENTVTMVNAGIESPLLHQPTSHPLREVISKKDVGMPLGLMAEFGFKSCQICLQPGESLLLCTDGVAGTLDVNKKPFGLSGIRKALRTSGDSTPRQLVEILARASRAHAAGRAPFDDVTIVCVRRSPFIKPSPSAKPGPTGRGRGRGKPRSR